MATSSSCEHRCNSRKLQKQSSVEEEDRISKLPNGILSQILSKLPQKQVERTSVLSARWRFLWALNPILKFVMPDCKTLTDVNSFMDFVERVMDFRNGLQIEQFHFDCLENCDYERVSALVCTVLKCDVQLLNLHLRGEHEKGITLPPAVFVNCESLFELTLCEYVVVDVPDNVHFPNLKILELRLVTYSNEASISNLVSGCPMLEELYVERRLGVMGDNIMKFCISSISLKLLDLIFSFVEEFHECDGYQCKYQTVINAPNVEDLSLRDHVSAEYMMNSGLPNLVKAHVDVERNCGTPCHIEAYSENVLGVIESISAAKSLFLSGSTLMALGITFVENLPSFHNLVKFSVGFDEIFGWRMLPSFLENMPNLVLLGFPYGLVPFGYPKDVSSLFSLNFEQYVPSCFTSSLKKIKISNFYGTTKEELKLIEYMLKNAQVLTTVKIDSSARISPHILQKLTKISRGSRILLQIQISGEGYKEQEIENSKHTSKEGSYIWSVRQSWC